MSAPPTNDRLLAWAQIGFSLLLFSGVIGVIILLEIGLASHLTSDQEKIFSNALRWLEDGAFLALGFWFQRIRSGGIPADTTITQTQTAPDGTKTQITSPAHVPPPPLPTAPGNPATHT